MKKVAKLVAVSLMTRVIVDENATDEEILTKAKSKFQEKINNNELGDNLEYIENDEEMPVGEGLNDLYYQPDFEDKNFDGNLFSYEVYRDKKNAQKDFPNCKILEYTEGDIENPTFID